MSGGVDSSVAAAELVRAGHDVVGVFMRLGSPGETLDEPIAAEACETGRPLKIGKQGCCSVGDAADARAVAAELGVPLYVCNFRDDFGRIIDYFVDEYARGRTPNPCVRCNDWLKFGKLHDYARQLGAEAVASGHYARVGERGRRRVLMRGRDYGKDQSYVLFGAPRDRLGEMVLPIGEYETKAEVRARAEELGLPVFDKPDSQEICFVPDNDYAGLVERKRPELRVKGRVIDEHGAVLGEHDGQHRFTIGQRRGLGIRTDEPVFVVEKDAAANTVRVASREALSAGSLVAAEANWLVDSARFGEWQRVLARVRHQGEAFAARARVCEPVEAPTPSGRSAAFEVAFDGEVEAVATGQAVVLYDAGDPDVVLGGGWIARVGGGDGH